MKAKIAFVLLLLGLAILSNAHAGFEEELAAIEGKVKSDMPGNGMIAEQAVQVAEKTAVPMNATASYNGATASYNGATASYNDYSIRISDMQSDGSLVSITVINTGNYVLHDVNIAVAPANTNCASEPCPTAPASQNIATINELYAGQKITLSVWVDYKVSWADVTTSEGAHDSFWLDYGHNTDLENRVNNLENRVNNIEGLILDLISLIKRVIGISGASAPVMK